MSTWTARWVAERVLEHVTPDDQARAAAARHRAEIERWLKYDLGIGGMRETGSWHHGTAVNIKSDVDYFVTMPGARPSSSWSTLDTVRGCLSRRLSGCRVEIDTPAVRITYRDRGPAVEITPAYLRRTDDYDIPEPGGTGWIPSNPVMHLDYVDKAQRAADGKAKGLVRLVKTWRTFNEVPLSSFYLEMRTAQYAAANAPILYDWDLYGVFKSLHDGGLREMNDPTDYGRRIAPGTRSLEGLLRAKNAVEDAARLTRLSKEATAAGEDARAADLMAALFTLSR